MSLNDTLSNNNERKIGYWFGKKLSEKHKRKIGRASRGRTHTEEAKRKISEALKGRRHTEEHRRKNSESHKGKKLPEETKKKIGDFWRGKKKIFSEEHRRKIIELRLRYNKNWKGKHHTEETKKKMSKIHKGKRFSETHKENISKNHADVSMSKNPNWQEGKSFELYGVNWTETLKDLVRKRDNYICRLCGKSQESISHDVHHIDYDKENCNLINLITLCHACHVKTNKTRNYWIKYFQIKIINNVSKRFSQKSL